MCEHSVRLVGWLDREMQPDDAAEMERHVAECAECQKAVAEFENASNSFEEYCEALAQSKEERKSTHVAPIWWAAAATVLLTVVVAYPRRHDAALTQTPRMAQPVQTVSSEPVTAKAAENVSAPFQHDHHAARSRARRGDGGAACCAQEMQSDNVSWAAEEPSVQIAIPSEAMFPPGAVPEGVNFVADVSIGADGRVEQLRLRPRPAGLERRTDQP
jgi:hypothetical protein